MIMINIQSKFASYQIDMEHLNNLPTKSSKIRYLYPILGTYYKVAQFLDIRVQHVRNVMVTPVANPKQ